MKNKPKITNSIALEYYRKANEFMAKNIPQGGAGYPTIRQDQPEFEAWAKYFDRLGWTPAVMQMAMNDPDREVTVPTQWPEWFDPMAAKAKADHLRLVTYSALEPTP